MTIPIRLGGFKRMRGHDMNRFSDKATLYGAVPELNPMNGQKWSPIPIN